MSDTTKYVFTLTYITNQKNKTIFETAGKIETLMHVLMWVVHCDSL